MPGLKWVKSLKNKQKQTNKQNKTENKTKQKQSKAKQSKAKQSKAKQSKAKQSKAKQNKTKKSLAVRGGEHYHISSRHWCKAPILNVRGISEAKITEGGVFGWEVGFSTKKGSFGDKISKT